MKIFNRILGLFLFLTVCLSADTPPPNPPPPPFIGTTLPVVLTNNSLLADSEVFVVLLGREPVVNGQQVFVQFDAQGVGTLVVAAPGQNAIDFTVALSALPAASGGRVFYVPEIDSAILYFSLDNALNMPVNSPNNIVQPNFSNPADPNYNTIFDIFEFAYVPTGTNIVADATAVSFFALPLYGFLSTPDISSGSNTGLYQPRPYIFDLVKSSFAAAPESSQWSNLILTSAPSTDLRVLSTGKGMFAAPNKFDINYLDNFAAYGYSYIQDIWSGPSSFYRTNTLTMTIPAGSGDTYNGVINNDNTITFTSVQHPAYVVVFGAPTSVSPTTTEMIFSGLPLQISDTSPGQQDGVQLSKLFEEAIIAGLVPTTAVLSNPYLLSSRPNLYQVNTNLSAFGQMTGPWYDLYSKVLHSLGYIYTYAFDEPLWPEVQITCQTYLINQTYLGVTIGPVEQAETTVSLVSSLNPSNPGDLVTFTATVSSSSVQSGTPTGTVQFSIDGNLTAPIPLVSAMAAFSTSSLTPGTHVIEAIYSGDVNFLGATSSPLDQQVNNPSKFNTTTGLASSLNPSTFGDSVTFTATVASVSPGTPTGTIQFRIDGILVHSAPLSGGTASFTTHLLLAGNHIVRAIYLGDGTFNGSFSPAVIQVVNQAPTTTTLTSSSNPSTFGSPVIFTATVSDNVSFATPTGSVIFTIDGIDQPQVPLVNGIAHFQTSTLSPGNHPVTATYSGSLNFATSTSSPLNQAVGLIASTTTLISSLNPSDIGQNVNFTSTVTPSSGMGTPTGSIEFYIDNSLVAVVALAGGQAVYSTAALTAGLHDVVAHYQGSATYAASISNTVHQVVFPNFQLASTTTLTSGNNPSVFGDSVTFTAAVTSNSGFGTPTGTVIFSVDGTPSAPVPLVNGSASFSTSSLAIGNHLVQAFYSGDVHFIASESTILDQLVLAVAPPIDGRGFQVKNKFVDQTDVINILSWENPVSGELPAYYKIYRNSSLTDLVGKVKARSGEGRYRFEDHNRRPHKTYRYYIVSVDGNGEKSAPLTITVK